MADSLIYEVSPRAFRGTAYRLCSRTPPRGNGIHNGSKIYGSGYQLELIVV